MKTKLTFTEWRRRQMRAYARSFRRTQLASDLEHAKWFRDQAAGISPAEPKPVLPLATVAA
jgi:hypothetical protein